jgi:hypothetical protein
MIISLLVYCILTFFSIKFVLWLYDINLDYHFDKLYNIEYKTELSLKNNKNYNDQALKLSAPIIKDMKINNIFYKKIFLNKGHKTLLVKLD